VFGTIKDGEINAKITDRYIEVNTDRFQRNTLSGLGARIIVSEDGRRIGVGGPIPERVAEAIAKT